MIDDATKIKALHDNICPKCGRHYMYYQNRCVTCGFCCNSWEITQDAIDNHVRICDTYTHKVIHGQL